MGEDRPEFKDKPDEEGIELHGLVVRDNKCATVWFMSFTDFLAHDLASAFCSFLSYRVAGCPSDRSLLPGLDYQLIN
jgi:hypothetical protein